MGIRGRLVIGACAAIAGIGLWVAVWATTKPLEIGPPPSEGGAPAWYGRVEASTMLRWSAVALAVGGLMLATRGWRRGTALSAGLGVAWLGTDAILVLSSVDSTPILRTVAMVVLIASATLVATASRRGEDSTPAWSLLVAAGVLVSMAVAVSEVTPGMFGADSFTRMVVPRAIVALAVVLALAAGPAPASRWRLAAATILAVVALALPPYPPGTALLMPVLIALSGALPPGGRGARVFGALVLGTLFFAFWLIGTGDWPARFGVEVTWRINPWAAAAAPVVTGAVLGVLALIAARFLRASAVPGPAVGAPAAASRARRDWRAQAGMALACAGVASWFVMALVVQPPISTLAESWRNDGVPRSWESIYEFEGLGWDLRWASIVLAAAGLRLLANGYRRTFLIGVVAWFLVDTVLVGLPVVPAVARPVEVAIGGLVLVGGLVLRARPAGTQAPSSAWSLLFSAGLAGVAIMLLGDDLSRRDDLPAAALPAAGALGVALVVAAVLTALAAAPRVQPGRAVAVSVLGAGALLALNAWRLSASATGEQDAQNLATAVAIAGLAAGCAWVGGYLRPAGRSVAAAVGLTIVAAPPVMMAGVLGASLLVALGNALFKLAVDLTGPFDIDDAARPLTGAGLLTGAYLAILLLLPRALSLPDADPAPPPVPALPSEPPIGQRPVAVPGVPEILEWPELERIPGT